LLLLRRKRGKRRLDIRREMDERRRQSEPADRQIMFGGGCKRLLQIGSQPIGSLERDQMPDRIRGANAQEARNTGENPCTS